MLDVQVTLAGQKINCPQPSVSDMFDWYDPQPAGREADDGEVICLAKATFGDVPPQAADSHEQLFGAMVHDWGLKNVWRIATQEHLPYPDAVLFAIASMFRGEEMAGRKADWLLWVDDDVVVPSALARILRKAADPEKRPFVAAVSYDRYPPFYATVWAEQNGEKIRWVDPPDKGTHEVLTCGLPAAIFHRSLFDKIPEPWFVNTPTCTKQENRERGAEIGMRPDIFWCNRLRERGVPVHVCCDAGLTHLGTRIPIHRNTVSILRKLGWTYPSAQKRHDQSGTQVRKKGNFVQSLPFDLQDKKFVFGLGTGRCGTRSLATLLAHQKDFSASHEGYHHLRPVEDEQTVRAHLAYLAIRETPNVADVAFYYLWHVETILKLCPNARFICLRRDREDTTQSALAWSPDCNLWQKHDGTQWRLRPGIDELFPNYPGPGPAEAHRQYWNDYYQRAEQLAEKYPDNFRIFETEDLNSDEKVLDILDFVGVDEPVIRVGVKENVRPG